MAPRTKRAAEVAALIETEINDNNLPVGTLIGAEFDLCGKYGISRGVFREAARLLEHYMVAQTKEGRGGGLYVAEPDVNTVARGAARLLRRMSAEPLDLAEARVNVEVSCVRLAVEKATQEDIDNLRMITEVSTMSSDGDFHGQAVHFHLALAQLSQNPALILFSQILGIVTQQRVAGRKPRASESAAIHAAHEGIVDAIGSRDPELAESRVREHFADLIASWGQRAKFTVLNSSSFGDL